uniref:RHOMBOID-like protein n=1 Tax=Leersia perrieri TaxID=77586 RepID=A0A0D9W8D0_9ORYZ
MSNADVEAGGRGPTGIKPPPGRYNPGGANAVAPAPPPFYYYDQPGAAAQERRHRTWVVPLVVVANVAMFVVVMYYNNCPAGAAGRDCVGRSFLRRFSFQPFRENPVLGPTAATLRKYGALDWYKVVHGNEAWRLETSTWLHAGLFHLLANMISLLIIGIRLEQQFGFWKVGLVYLVSGFGGSVLSVLFINRNGISVGASGALFGLLGAMLSELITNWSIYSNRCAAMVNLIIIAAINLALGILPHVDNFAHIGGFATGFLIGFVLLIQPQFGWAEPSSTKSKYNAFQIVLLILSVVLLIAGFTVGLIMVFRGEDGNAHCSWCHYLTCVPTSSWKCDR